MAAVSLTTLRSRARERADMVGSTFVADSATSLDAWINRGLEVVHQKLVDAYDEEYLTKSHSFTTANGTEAYALPSDFLKLLQVELSVSGKWITLHRYTRREQNAYRSSNMSWYGLPRYRLDGSNVRFLPAPDAAYSARLAYAPLLQVTPSGNRLVNGTDTVDFIGGWEDYAVVYAAIQALAKEESDTSALAAELARMDAELEAIKLNRDAAEPHQAVDVEVVDIDPRWL